MIENPKYALKNSEKKKFIDALTEELTTLRSKAGISQDELSNFVGISRQTYGNVERKARKMSWNTYLTLILFYDYNEKTHDFIRTISAFPHELLDRINETKKSIDKEVDDVLSRMNKDIFSSLDQQAINTIKTVVMVEYSRCKSVTADSVMKLFEGLSFEYLDVTPKDEETMDAIKKIKK